MYNYDVSKIKYLVSGNVVLPNNPYKQVSSDILNSKIEKVQSHLNHLNEQLGQKPNTHRGKNYRSHISTIKFNIEEATGRLGLYTKAKEILNTKKKEEEQKIAEEKRIVEAKRIEEVKRKEEELNTFYSTISRTIESSNQRYDKETVEQYSLQVYNWLTYTGKRIAVISPRTTTDNPLLHYSSTLEVALNYLLLTGKISSYALTSNNHSVRLPGCTKKDIDDEVRTYSHVGPEITAEVLHKANEQNCKLYEVKKD